jgi:AAA domain
VVDSRPAKPHGPIPERLHRWWDGRLRALGFEHDRLLAAVMGRQWRQVGLDSAAVAQLVDQSLGSLTARQSTWRPAELVRELAANLPTTITVDPEQLTPWLERLADHVLTTRCADISRPAPDGVSRRRDGRPISEAATDRTLTTQAILDQEERILKWAERRLAPDHQPSPLPAALRGGLDAAQAAVAAVVASGRPLELVVGAAGTGKTTALGPAVTHLHRQGRVVFGVAPNAAAAQALAAETGMPTDTLDKLLHEHHQPDRPPHPRFALPAGVTLVVDEAGAVATAKLAQIAQLADRQRWRVILVGDPRQFSAVGRGGMFGHLVATYGADELDQVHRLTHHWERQASLRLRKGDPLVLTEYHRHGRLHGGTTDDMEAEVIAAWQQARDHGQTVALMANSHDTVDRLNRLGQTTRISAGELNLRGPRLRLGDQMSLVGDEVVTRRNDRTLRTDQGLMVKNRDHWTLTAIHGDRSVTLTGPTGNIRLPADYVTQHLELGYAQTSHANQGRTVDTALLLVDGTIDSRGVYTPMTRGRDANHAYVVTENNQTALDVLAQAMTRDRIDQPAIARRGHLDHHRNQRTLSTLGTDPEEKKSHDVWLGERRHLVVAEQNPRDEKTAVERRIEQLIVERRARTEREHATGRSHHRGRGVAIER